MTLHDLTGHTLAQYELRELLGVGGMGVAYRAFQRNLERDVAVKVLSTALANDPGYIERFYREAKTAASLEHTHIVPVYDYGVQGDISYVVMRYLTGGSLEDRMTQRARTGGELPSLGEIAHLLEQLADALDYAHARGVIHRDIKPANIMFDDQGKAFVVDFGIAKLLEATTAFTESGGAMGTPLYMPPEQWRSEKLTPAADQYALAVTIFHLMTGRLPFEASTPYGMLHKHLNEAPAAARTYREDVPDSLTQVIDRALAKRPEDRYETVTAFADAFADAVLEGSGSQTGFFTTPLLKMKTSATMGGSGINILISPDSPLVTQGQPRSRVKSTLFWLASIVITVVITAVLLSVLVGDGSESSGAAAATQAAMVNGTVTALAMTAQVNGDMTATVLSQMIIAPYATEEANTARTATQRANDRQAEQTLNAVQTEVKEKAGEEIAMTSTANAWTATPTETTVPTLTYTPAPTLTATAEPANPPNLRAVYDQNSFVLTNISDREIDVTRLVFELAPDTGSPRIFSGYEWANRSISALIPPGKCLIFLRQTIQSRPPAPPPEVCPRGLESWFGSSLNTRFFWDDQAPGAETFQVWFDPLGTGPRVELATCKIAADECTFALLPQE